MDKLLTVGEAAIALGVSTSTLRRWDKQKKLIPKRTKGGQRRYSLSQINPHLAPQENHEKLTLAYARVSSYDQKEDCSRSRKNKKLIEGLKEVTDAVCPQSNVSS